MSYLKKKSNVFRLRRAIVILMMAYFKHNIFYDKPQLCFDCTVTSHWLPIKNNSMSFVTTNQAMYKYVQGDQKVSVHLTIKVQSSGARRVLINLYNVTYRCVSLTIVAAEKQEVLLILITCLWP